MGARSENMTNYRRLISYIYAYEGDVKGKNIGFAKLESRNGQCKLSVNVKKVYVGSSDLSVYLLASGREIPLGSIFIRGGSGEFRAVVSVENAADSGCSLDQCYGLTIHEKNDSWRAYTTIWEDAVAHAAEVELADVTSGKLGNSETQIHKKVEELEKEINDKVLSSSGEPALPNTVPLQDMDQETVKVQGENASNGTRLPDGEPVSDRGTLPVWGEAASESKTRENEAQPELDACLENSAQPSAEASAGTGTGTDATLAGEMNGRPDMEYVSGDSEHTEIEYQPEGSGQMDAEYQSGDSWQAENMQPEAGGPACPQDGEWNGNQMTSDYGMQPEGEMQPEYGMQPGPEMPCEYGEQLAAEAQPGYRMGPEPEMQPEYEMQPGSEQTSEYEMQPEESAPCRCGSQQEDHPRSEYENQMNRTNNSQAMLHSTEALRADTDNGECAESEEYPDGKTMPDMGRQPVRQFGPDSNSPFMGNRPHPVVLPDAIMRQQREMRNGLNRYPRANMPNGTDIPAGANTPAGTNMPDHINMPSGLDTVPGTDIPAAANPQPRRPMPYRNNPRYQRGGFPGMGMRTDTSVQAQPTAQPTDQTQRLIQPQPADQTRQSDQTRPSLQAQPTDQTRQPAQTRPSSQAQPADQTRQPAQTQPSAQAQTDMRSRPAAHNRAFTRPRPAPKTDPVSSEGDVTEEKPLVIDSAREEMLLGNPQELERLEQEEQENLGPRQLWEDFRKRYPKIQAFDSMNGCEILTIKPQDIGLLPRENWNYGNNSFLLHGYYNYRYLILARIGDESQGRTRYILGVPGHYYSNEKYMASMFGFPHFVLSKKQPSQDGRFGYWYTDVRMQNQD